MAVTRLTMQIPKRNDNAWFEGISTYAQKSNLSPTEFESTLSFSGQTFKKSDDKEIVEVRTLNGMYVANCSQKFSNHWKLSLKREANPHWDELTLSVDDEAAKQSTQPIAFIRASRVLQEVFGEINRTVEISEALGKDLQAHYEARDVALNRMETSVHNSIAELNRFTLKLTKEFQEKAAQLEKEAEARKIAADAELAKAKAEIAQEKSKLDAKIAEVNLRESKVERRSTIQTLITALDSSKQGFSLDLTAGTKKLRQNVVLGSIAAIVVIALLAIGYGVLEYRSTASSSWSWVRLSLASVGLVGALGYFAQWLNSVYLQHANEEFRLKRLLLDVRRANLLIETALEWEQESDKDIPKPIVDSLSRDLFVESPRDREASPVETLASLIIRSAVGMRLKAGNSEIELGGKEFQKAAKTIADSH